MPVATDADELLTLAGERIVFLGRLASMPQRAAEQHVREAGGEVLPHIGPRTTLAVVGEDSPPAREWLKRDVFAEPEVQSALAAGRLRLVRESELWQRLGVLEVDEAVQRLYTPSMLAELVGVPVATIRRWHRAGLLQSVREVQRLALFDFGGLAAARHLAGLADAGCTLREIRRAVGRLAQSMPDVPRPLSTLPIVIEGRQLLVREGDDLVEPGGQLRMDFEVPAEGGPNEGSESECLAADRIVFPPVSPDEMLEAAADLEDAGDLTAAANMYRAVLAATGPNAEVNFLLADVLYAQGDLTAARERYYAAVEIEEDFVEPRANLGCVLAELGELELAAATFQGALDCLPEYADVHLHLARTLDSLGRRGEAEPHWRTFLQLAPDSLWADEAAQRLL